jgi:phosphatidate cytidylyltransferase
MQKSNPIKRILTALALTSYGLFVFLFLHPIFTTITMAAILTWIMLYEWPKIIPYPNYARVTGTLAYPVVSFVCIIALNHSEYRSLVLPLLILPSVHDTMAYAIGRPFGRIMLLPQISPRKTLEGVAAGLFGVFIALYNPIISWHIPYTQAAIIAVSISILATTGDLFESWLKRKANVKDSGTILPGQGGFLDRFDAILFIAPLFWLLRQPLMKLFYPSSLQ